MDEELLFRWRFSPLRPPVKTRRVGQIIEQKKKTMTWKSKSKKCFAESEMFVQNLEMYPGSPRKIMVVESSP